MSAPAVSVIVLNHNGRAWLPSCVAALAAQTGAPPFELIVADNASTDGSTDLLAGAPASLRILQNGANLGFAGGNNAAARAARGKWLVFLNNDTIPAPDWLARLHVAAVERPGFALVASRIVFLEDPSIVDSAGDGYLRVGGAFKHGHRARASDALESREVFGACGAAFLIQREVFEALGGFDESFFLVYEDVDLSYRARLRGHRCWYAADAVVRHAGSATMGRLSPLAVFYGQRNLEWTWIKNTPAALLIRTAPAHIVYSLAGLAYYARHGRLGPALKGKLAALGGLRAVLRRRRAVQSSRVADPSAWMDRGWVATKRREKRAAREEAVDRPRG